MVTKFLIPEIPRHPHTKINIGKKYVIADVFQLELIH